jgi:hypothetical protein
MTSKRKKKQRSPVDIPRQVLDDALAAVLADAASSVERRGKRRGKWRLERSDPAETIVVALALDRRQDLPSLARSTGLRVGPMLRALTELQRFGLVEVSGGAAGATALGEALAAAIDPAGDEDDGPEDPDA